MKDGGGQEHFGKELLMLLSGERQRWMPVRGCSATDRRVSFWLLSDGNLQAFAGENMGCASTGLLSLGTVTTWAEIRMCVVRCRMFNSNPDLHLLDASITSLSAHPA